MIKNFYYLIKNIKFTKIEPKFYIPNSDEKFFQICN